MRKWWRPIHSIFIGSVLTVVHLSSAYAEGVKFYVLESDCKSALGTRPARSTDSHYSISQATMDHIIYGTLIYEPVPLTIGIVAGKRETRTKDAPVIKSGLHTYKGLRTFIAKRKKIGEIIELHDSAELSFDQSNLGHAGVRPQSSARRVSKPTYGGENKDLIQRSLSNVIMVLSSRDFHTVTLPKNMLAYSLMSEQQINANQEDLIIGEAGTYKSLFPDYFTDDDIRMAINLVLPNPDAPIPHHHKHKHTKDLTYIYQEEEYSITVAVFMDSNNNVTSAFPLIDESIFDESLDAIAIRNAHHFREHLAHLVIFSKQHRSMIHSHLKKSDTREMFQFVIETMLDNLLKVSPDQLNKWGVARAIRKNFISWQTMALKTQHSSLEEKATALRKTKILKKQFDKMADEGHLKALILAYQNQIEALDNSSD